MSGQSEDVLASAWNMRDPSEQEAVDKLNELEGVLPGGHGLWPSTAERLELIAEGMACAEAASYVARQAGWTASVIKRLLEIAEKLSEALGKAAKDLDVESFSVGVSVPTGITVALTWSGD